MIWILREFLNLLALSFENLCFRDEVLYDLRRLILVLLPHHLLHGFVELASLGRCLGNLLLDLLVDFIQLGDPTLFIHAEKKLTADCLCLLDFLLGQIASLGHFSL